MGNRIMNPRKNYFVKKVYNFKCNHCKKKKISEELEIDHIIPLANGGTNDYSNLQPLCIECHLKKTKGEWKEGYGDEQENNLTPEEKLEILKDFLEENKSHSYPEIQFLILNSKVLSSFYYNSTTLSLLWKEMKGIKARTGSAVKYKIQRDLIIKGLYSKINSLRKLSEGLKDWGVSMSPRGIGFIVNKKEEDKKDEKGIKETNPHI